MIVAEFTSQARRHAQWRPLTAEEETAAVTGLRALAAGRADLLAEVAGILEGTREGEPDEPIAWPAARLRPIRRRSLSGAAHPTEEDAEAAWLDIAQVFGRKAEAFAVLFPRHAEYFNRSRYTLPGSGLRRCRTCHA
jgi:hypothetical protein